MTPLVRDYESLLEAISLAKGAHQAREGRMCAMEAAAWIAGEPHSDHPKCASRVITSFLISWNDSLPTDEDRNRLIKPLLPLVVDTAADEKIELRRSFMALDWLLRECAPTFLALTPSLVEHAESLRSSPEVATLAAVKAIQPKAFAARDAAGDAARDAAWAAAWDAARDAAGDAARDAAWAAARDAARDAAGDAARDAAGDAAWAAAWDAAGDAAWAAAWAAARDAAGDAARDAAGAAAWAAAWAAARDAAWAAAWDAAGDAAWAAARAAAWDAAGAAAGDAAWAAARDALKPAVESLQASAVLLVRRMCEAK